MSDLLEQIDRLFGGPPTCWELAPALATMMQPLEPLRPLQVFLADEDGHLLSRYPVEQTRVGEALPAVAHEVCEWLRSAGRVVLRPEGENGRELHVVAFRLTGFGQGGAAFGAVVESEPDEQAISGLEAELIRLGDAVTLAVRLHNQLREVQTRVRHLEAELHTLRRAHEDTITNVLSEREARLVEKRRHIVQLESEVRRRSAALRDALGRAEEASRAKTEFLANMSHEIRTPMTAILGYSEQLLEPDLDEGERLAAVHTIRRNGEHLLEIINDILDLSKIEAGKLEIERVRFCPVQLVDDLVELMRPRAEAKGLVLEVTFGGPIPETIETDPTRIRQILLNLLGNAVKFTETGGVELNLSVEPPADDNPAAEAQMHFSVRDTGIGLTETQLARLFQPFAQADASHTRRFGGTGLGLMISKRLATQLGGKLAATSRAGEGSTFVATIAIGSLAGVTMIEDVQSLIEQRRGALRRPTFNAGAASAGPTPRSSIPAAPATGPRLPGSMRILVAEDGPDNQRLLVAMLERAGARVSVVENGRLACDAALGALERGEPFDLILMDMQMPEMDGYQATAMLRRLGYKRPVIALTAHAMSGDRDKCLAAGCDDYATKPINRAALFETLARYAPTAATTSH